MEKLLFSHLQPIRNTDKETFAHCFRTLFENTDKVCIAIGYVSTEALTELRSFAEANKKQVVLVIGMHYFEGITKTQYQALLYLHDFLIKNACGCVYVVNTFKFHGKLYAFYKDKDIYAGIIGSSNLNGILENHSNYEVDVLFNSNDKATIVEVDNFISELIKRTCIPVSDWEPNGFIESNQLLEGHENVERCSREEIAKIISQINTVVFKIPIKSSESAPRSNINAYFGKGRENSRGFVQPRHWYEVELIVPKEITDSPDYPKAGFPNSENIITVYTDDSWKFNCKTSGSYSKNLRSCDDLKILGKWLKGRLENYGVLNIGEQVTEATLREYGRDYIKMCGTSDPKVWYLDFSPRSKK